jgi:hypothetical protein
MQAILLLVRPIRFLISKGHGCPVERNSLGIFYQQVRTLRFEIRIRSTDFEPSQ